MQFIIPTKDFIFIGIIEKERIKGVASLLETVFCPIVTLMS